MGPCRIRDGEFRACRGVVRCVSGKDSARGPQTFAELPIGLFSQRVKLLVKAHSRKRHTVAQRTPSRECVWIESAVRARRRRTARAAGRR
ncbi:hypothetical protein DB31_7673 [Hyalangium minutum]|uniref:Uncharacterized protein n=1 Tax=Hyalangium minutum TaxID=394096 RepID=A0A085WL73_9BACT|nr:hypothetical protein DB31_7673 [Hyalangium minutum]